MGKDVLEVLRVLRTFEGTPEEIRSYLKSLTDEQVGALLSLEPETLPEPMRECPVLRLTTPTPTVYSL